MVGQQQVIIKNYKGNQERVTAWFQDDAKAMAARGYYPTSQIWAPGTYGCGAFLVALLLCFILIGFIVFVYMLVVKPDGTLTVTYEWRGSSIAQAQVTVGADKICPRCAEQVKSAALVCRFCGHQFDPETKPTKPHVPAAGPKWLGISLRRLSSERAKHAGMEGVYVEEVEQDSTAYQMGLRTGDVIVSLYGHRIREREDLLAVTERLLAGQLVALELVRNRQIQSIQIIISMDG